MRLKPLDKVIKVTRRRECILCKGPTHSEVVSKTSNRRKTKVTARVFVCKNCPAVYSYDRDGTHFKIDSLNYTYGDYTIECTYGEDNTGFIIMYDPYPEQPYVDSTLIVESDSKVPFPITKEELEDKIQMFITFS